MAATCGGVVCTADNTSTVYCIGKTSIENRSYLVNPEVETKCSLRIT